MTAVISKPRPALVVPGRNISVFAKQAAEVFSHRFAGALFVGTIAGGTPSDPNVAEGWLKTKLGVNKDDMIRQMVADVMVERGIDAEAATDLVNQRKHLNGFKRARCADCPADHTAPLCNGGVGHQLYIEGRQLKAGIKEAVSCAVATEKLKARGWGTTNKGIHGFMAEHAFVVEEKLLLSTEDGEPVCEPTGIMQRFVSTFRGTGIQYEEFVTGAVVPFTIISDFNFTDKDWATIWVEGEKQGLGASRSQGFGTYSVIRWDRV